MRHNGSVHIFNSHNRHSSTSDPISWTCRMCEIIKKDIIIRMADGHTASERRMINKNRNNRLTFYRHEIFFHLTDIFLDQKFAEEGLVWSHHKCQFSWLWLPPATPDRRADPLRWWGQCNLRIRHLSRRLGWTEANLHSRTAQHSTDRHSTDRPSSDRHK